MALFAAVRLGGLPGGAERRGWRRQQLGDLRRRPSRSDGAGECTDAGGRNHFLVDHHDYRLKFAADTYGVHLINFDTVDDPAEQIIEVTQFRGVDASIDAVGFEAKGSTLETALTTLKLEGSSGQTLRQCIAATRRGGVVSVPGVYAGFIHGFLIGDAFEKGLSFRMGQTHVQQHMPQLLRTHRQRPAEAGSHRQPPTLSGGSRARLRDVRQETG